MSYELFQTKAQAVSAEVHRFASGGQALDFLLGFLRQEGIKDEAGAQALWAPGPWRESLDQAALARDLPGLKFTVTRELAASAKMGISQMDWGLADTGSVAQDATGIEQRLVSTLPWIHVAILPTSAILPDLPTLLARVDPARMGYVSIITGPSRTADIERVLTIGVHGPERLVILCVDNLPEAGS
jgi:L-lactate dehydrogenase complex protein LldG